ncbi:helix-turn-helix transcriptional regulator [Prolixibacter bellariivorans]|nr:LuxR C-terminal-related transcriptional regulator [Prolixibacter bellariivorans]
MVHKEKELANASMEMIQKNKMLIKIKNDLKVASENVSEETVQAKLKSILKRVDRQVNNEKQWQVFETHFETVHEDFLSRIKDQFPELSPKELKLCAYLRMNVSSKEIAALMNISVRGVEISRYRLRKKLRLQRHENLTDFILSY